MRTNRRSFLKVAGLAILGNRATARRLILLETNGPAFISKIEWIVYDTGLRAPRGASEHRCAVRISTSSGAQAWSDAPAWTMPDSGTRQSIRSVVLERNVNDLESIWRELFDQGVPLGTLAGVDTALWDLRGRIANRPVHALLGTQRQRARAYLTTAFNLGEPEVYAARAVAAREAGLHGCKIHPYIEWGTGQNGRLDGGFPDRDMAVYEAVRVAVGPDYPCVADNHRTYTYEEALRVGRRLDDLDYAWYESPMPEEEGWRDRYVALAGQLKTPVCAPEAHSGSYPARVSWMAAKACDITRISVLDGGLTACLELATACEAAGIPLELRGIGPDGYPHLQMIGATAEALIKHVEVFSLSHETTVRPGRTTPEPVLDSQGYVAIPQTPGMGLELDWTYIFTHRAR